MRIKLAYGKTGLPLELDDSLDVTVVEPTFVPALADPAAAVRAALEAPIGSPPLRELVRPGTRVGVVFSDITRPAPNPLLLGAVLEVLDAVPGVEVDALQRPGHAPPQHRGRAPGDGRRRRLRAPPHRPERHLRSVHPGPRRRDLQGPRDLAQRRAHALRPQGPDRVHRAPPLRRILRRRQGHHAGHGRPAHRPRQPRRRDGRPPPGHLGRHPRQPHLGGSARGRRPGRPPRSSSTSPSTATRP
ncbi:MAG: lactate racemase domain-containing protein [Marinilabiliales bacterium]|nr:lactate racemase domain-containing protein [Marinilabiliales bacterium]